MNSSVTMNNMQFKSSYVTVSAKKCTHTVQCCTIQNSTVQYSQVSTVQYSAVLTCTILSYSVLSCTMLYCTLLYYPVPSNTVLFCPVLYCTVLYYSVLHYSVLFCSVLYPKYPSISKKDFILKSICLFLTRKIRKKIKLPKIVKITFDRANSVNYELSCK